MKRFQWTLRKSMVRIAFLACLLAIPTLPYQCDRNSIGWSNHIHGLADRMVKQEQICRRLERQSRAAGRFQEADWYRNLAENFARRERKLRREAWEVRRRHWGDWSYARRSFFVCSTAGI